MELMSTDLENFIFNDKRPKKLPELVKILYDIA